jgi:PAS domain S-box-containing protein
MRFEESDNSAPSRLDFVPRERRNQGQQLVTFSLLIIAFVLLFGYVPALRDMAITPILTVIAIASLCFYVIYRYQQALDLLMHTEFQNLLFSQGMVLGSTFCMIVQRDGTITYAGDGLGDIFGHTGYSKSAALETLFSNGGVGKADRERILGAIYNNVTDRIVFHLTLPNGVEQTYILTLEPFARPSGYVLLRGREYRGDRMGTQMLPDMLRSTSADKLDHMFATTPVAHYATDAFGRFEYVNQAFETCLGYFPGEVLDTRLTLTSAVRRLAGQSLSYDYTIADFAGHATIANKEGELIDCLLFQTIIRDERGKATGATGSIVIANVMQ